MIDGNVYNPISYQNHPMFQTTNEIISEIKIQQLGTYRVEESVDSIYLQNEV